MAVLGPSCRRDLERAADQGRLDIDDLDIASRPLPDLAALHQQQP